MLKTLVTAASEEIGRRIAGLEGKKLRVTIHHSRPRDQDKLHQSYQGTSTDLQHEAMSDVLCPGGAAKPGIRIPIEEPPVHSMCGVAIKNEDRAAGSMASHDPDIGTT